MKQGKFDSIQFHLFFQWTFFICLFFEPVLIKLLSQRSHFTFSALSSCLALKCSLRVCFLLYTCLHTWHSKIRSKLKKTVIPRLCTLYTHFQFMSFTLYTVLRKIPFYRLNSSHWGWSISEIISEFSIQYLTTTDFTKIWDRKFWDQFQACLVSFISLRNVKIIWDFENQFTKTKDGPNR